MVGHKICFYGKIGLIISKLSLLPLLIWNTDDTLEVCLRGCQRVIPLEATSEDDWLHTDVGRCNYVRLVKCSHNAKRDDISNFFKKTTKKNSMKII